MDNELEIVREHMLGRPVNVAAIFEALGVNYDEKPLPYGESGSIELRDGNFNVLVNSNESEQRKRFTAAHELAHYLMHRDLLQGGERLNRHTDRLFGEDARNNRDAPFKHKHEVQANKLAAQIIMPASRIRESWDNMESKDRAYRIGQLSSQFDVSKKAMEIRLETLGLLE